MHETAGAYELLAFCLLPFVTYNVTEEENLVPVYYNVDKQRAKILSTL